MALIDRTVAWTLSLLVLAVALRGGAAGALAYGHTVTPYTWATWISDLGQDNAARPNLSAPTTKP